MHKTRIISLIVILLICFSTKLYPQNKALQKDEIEKSLKEAITNYKINNYEKSLRESRIALKHAIEINDNNLIARCYNIIGANFDDLIMLDKALVFYQKALYYIDKTDDSKLKAKIHNNLGNTYFFYKKEYQKGINHYEKSLQYSENSADNSRIYLRKLNITWAYFEIKNFDKGLDYLNYINKFKQYGDEPSQVALNMLNGIYNDHINDTIKANTFFMKAIALGNESHEKFDLAKTHEKYAAFLSKNHNYKKAFENIIQLNTLNRELTESIELKKTKLVGVNLELDEYKREVDKIETQYKSKQEFLLQEQSRNKKVVSIMVSLFLVSIILFYFFYQNTKLKQNNRLKDIQSKIQQNIINASIDGQESERKKIALFLHDNISALLSSAGMHLNVFSTQNEPVSEEILKTKFILEEAHDKVRDLSHELLPTLLVRFGLFYALEDLCEKNSNSTIHFEYSCTIPSKTRYHEKFEMRIYFIISELLNNIIKHSEATIASVSLVEEDSKLIINVNDNGKGYKTNKFNIIEGFGLNQIRARIKNLKGEIIVKSKIDMGTSIRIEVPIMHQS
ncbi:histidine kinase [Flavobacterium sp. LS1R49]|uniref:histidine kinase n=1 Tax=Flavobacterium shii TaxID=2987687 RepID=A0A9X3BWU5_9FLAO|nr:ATP-binding protein [Flavobacterium shii]MCV9926080.1 histidine kinase [Flavobacterium shii]